MGGGSSLKPPLGQGVGKNHLGWARVKIKDQPERAFTCEEILHI